MLFLTCAITRCPPLPAKSEKGVKGITDDDYKFIATKDSGRKKNCSAGRIFALLATMPPI
jgi:hypothetical protein